MARKYAYSEPEHMLRQVLSKHKLLDKPLLLAISAGKDSMALWQAAHALGLHYGVAYYHHGLRPEADEDVKLVAHWAAHRGIAHHIGYGDVKAQLDGHSVQDRARTMRYSWLNETADGQYAAILTAHHQADYAETVMQSLLRGGDFEVLSGIHEQWGRVLRPWLRLGRQAIDDYVSAHSIPYLEDASNSDLHYQRNYLRHQVLPLLAAVNPSYAQKLYDTAERYRSQLALLYPLMDGLLAERVVGHTFYLKDEHDALLLDYWLQQLHLPRAQRSQIAGLLTAEKGTCMLGWRREQASIVQDKGQAPAVPPLVLHHLPAQVHYGRCEILIAPAPAYGPTDAHTAYLSQHIALPLTIRLWQHGDRIRLLGGPEKKVSDVLTDAKVPSATRASYWVVADAEGSLLYLQGQRIAEQARVPAHATACWQLSWWV